MLAAPLRTVYYEGSRTTGIRVSFGWHRNLRNHRLERPWASYFSFLLFDGLPLPGTRAADFYDKMCRNFVCGRTYAGLDPTRLLAVALFYRTGKIAPRRCGIGAALRARTTAVLY